MTTTPPQSQPFVTATQLVRDFPLVRQMADQGPVRITSHGRTEAIILSPQDYTALTTAKQTDNSLLEWKLSLVLDSIDIHILILDETMRIHRTNRFFAESFATPVEELIGKNAASLVNSPSDHFIVQRLAEVLASGQPEVIVVPSPQERGRILRVTMKPWPGGVALFAEDITEREQFRDRKIADDATDLSLESLGGIGIAHVQSNGTILMSSLALTHMVGSPTDSLVGARLQNLFDPACRTMVSDALKETSAESRCYDVRYLRQGVKLVSAMLSVTPYWTAEHHACAAVALHDPQYRKPDCGAQDEAA